MSTRLRRTVTLAAITFASLRVGTGCVREATAEHDLTSTLPENAHLMLAGMLIVATLIAASVALAMKAPKHGGLALATLITGFAIWRLVNEAWEHQRPQGVRILLLAAASILAYELYVLFSIVLTG